MEALGVTPSEMIGVLVGNVPVTLFDWALAPNVCPRAADNISSATLPMAVDGVLAGAALGAAWGWAEPISFSDSSGAMAMAPIVTIMPIPRTRRAQGKLFGT